jgi:hypothetical protein
MATAVRVAATLHRHSWQTPPLGPASASLLLAAPLLPPPCIASHVCAEAAGACAACCGQAAAHGPPHQGQRTGAGKAGSLGIAVCGSEGRAMVWGGRKAHVSLADARTLLLALFNPFACPAAGSHVSLAPQPRHGGGCAGGGWQGHSLAAGDGGRHLVLGLAQPRPGRCAHPASATLQACCGAATYSVPTGMLSAAAHSWP